MKHRYIVTGIPRNFILRRIIKEICLIKRAGKFPKNQNGYVVISEQFRKSAKSKSLILQHFPNLSLVTWCDIKHQNDDFFPIHHPNKILLEFLIKNLVIRFGY